MLGIIKNTLTLVDEDAGSYISDFVNVVLKSYSDIFDLTGNTKLQVILAFHKTLFIYSFILR